MLSKWCEVTSFAGVFDLYESRHNKFRFAFWLIVMVLMIIGSVGFTYATINNFISTPTVTAVSTVSSPTMAMPDLFLCYNGGLNVSSLKAANFSENFILALNSQIYGGNQQNTSSFDVKQANQEMIGYMKEKNHTLLSLIYNSGYNCFALVDTYIKPLNRPKNENLVMCKSIETIITSNGKCFVFRNNTYQWYPDVRGGIELVLNFPKDSYVSIYPEEAFRNRFKSIFYISLEGSFGHSQTLRSVIVPMNSHTEITLNTKRYKRLPENKPCDSGESTYSSNTCFYDCYEAELERVCGCMYVDVVRNYKLNVLDICNPFTYTTDCLIKIDSNRVRECNKYCVPKCDEWIYETTVSNGFHQGDINTARSRVAIGYSTMQYMLIEEVWAFTLDMAVANVGGQSGLWLGCSIVTIVQLIYYLFLACYEKCRKRTLIHTIESKSSNGSSHLSRHCLRKL